MKKTLILILCFSLMMVMAVGCQPAETTESTTSGEATTAETTTMGPPAEIFFIFPVLTGPPADMQMIEDEINEISIAKANVKATILPISVANYSSQVPLMITGNEDMDLVLSLPGGPTVYATMVSQGQYKDITESGPMYAPGIIDAFNEINPNYLAGAYINGKLYGFPTLFDKVSTTFFDIRKDALDENNLTESFKSVKNMTDLEAVVSVLAANSDIPVLASTGNNWGQVLFTSQRLINYDDFSASIVSEFFGSADWAYGAILGDDNYNVINMYASDWYKNMITLAHDWYEKDYISKDAATQIDNQTVIIDANGALGCINNGELGHQTLISTQTGYDMISIEVADPIVNTDIIQKFVWGLPVTCQNDEAALKFLELIYTDADIVNLINFGIEDTHYVRNGDGTISLPEGVEASSARYWQNATFLFGQAFLADVVAPDPADLRDQSRDLNKNAATSLLMGFSVDSSGFANEYTAVINAIVQYSPGLNAGSSDPDTVLPQFLAALDAAGMQTIIDEVQAQVDAFVAMQ